MADVRLSLEEYLALIAAANVTRGVVADVKEDVDKVAMLPTKVRRKATAYQRRYKAAFRRLKSTYMTAAGKWKKGGFKKAVKAAHKEAKR